MKKLLILYKKYEEIICYLIVGGMTTLVSILVYALFTRGFHVYYQTSNVISWIVSVTFAFFANKYFVFKSNKKDIVKEIYEFFKYRLVSLAIDMILMYLLVSMIHIDDMIAKVFVQVIVIVLNYFFSKLFVFKK